MAYLYILFTEQQGEWNGERTQVVRACGMKKLCPGLYVLSYLSEAKASLSEAGL